MMPSVRQSALDAAGLQAAQIETLWWAMFWVTTAVFLAVVGAVALAVGRSRTRTSGSTSDGALGRAVTAASGLSLAILVGLLFVSVLTGRAVGTRPDPTSLTIQVTGYQWWWSVEYLNAEPALRVVTANELHIPVGRPVIVNLRSGDVIHSFWVPNLHGKTDLIPGRLTSTWIQADRAGIFRGQCGEYCGLQHAHMGLVVIAESPDDFDRWLSHQRTTPSPPSTALAHEGRALLEHGPCGMCHTVRGTSAGARTAPDLTHFATRSTIAAATLSNTRDRLTQWIADPQHVKPGNRMPATGLTAQQVTAVVAYLETLR
jgi:cytochrome c oxidase subunit II